MDPLKPRGGESVTAAAGTVVAPPVETVEDWVRRTRAEQGLSDHVEDARVLRQVARDLLAARARTTQGGS